MAANDETRLRLEIAEAGRRLYSKGYIAGADGNISALLPCGGILITPSGVSKGFMRPEDLIITDRAGGKISGPGVPSSEIKMHLLIYDSRPDVRAVVHAHPPTVTGYAAAGLLPDSPIVAEGILTLGRMALAAYGTPGSAEVTDGMKPFVRDCDAILMANHGAVTCGGSVEQALFKMETLEHIAEIHLVTEALGRKSEISPANLEKLAAIRAALLARQRPGPAPDRRLAEIVAQAVAEALAARAAEKNSAGENS